MRIIHVLRKPLSEGTVAANTLKHGCGGLNIDASRISTEDNLNGGAYALNPTPRAGEDMWTRDRKGDTNCFKRGGAGRSSLPGDTREGASAGMFQPNSTATSNFVQPTGRWPANVILQHLDGCRCAGIKRVRATSIHGESIAVRRSGVHHTAGGHQSVGRKQPVTGHADKDGKETIANWVCGPGCPVARLDEQSGVTTSTGGRTVNISTTSTIYGGGKGLGQALSSDEVRGDPGFGDTGGASRFYKQIGGKENA